jgi:hypothetical protein
MLLLMIFQSSDSPIEGNWKLAEYSGFLTILSSSNFNSLSEEQKTRASESFQFALDNTFYNFKKDSVFFTDAGGDFIVKEKNGKFLINSDTLVIFESGKFKVHKFFISSLSNNELKMKIIHKDGVVGVTEMKFQKVD